MSRKPQTPTRRHFVASAAIAASTIASLKVAIAQPSPEAPKEADFLFLQSAKGVKFDKANNKLTLTGVSPVTIYFTDRPERVAGNMKTTRFIPFWSEGKDSFKSNPPNADVSIVAGNDLKQIIVELLDPVLVGDDLSYTVRVLQGEMPPAGADVSVFIDIIGRPLTPFSYAGVARRTFRRGFYR